MQLDHMKNLQKKKEEEEEEVEQCMQHPETEKVAVLSQPLYQSLIISLSLSLSFFLPYHCRMLMHFSLIFWGLTEHLLLNHSLTTILL